MTPYIDGFKSKINVHLRKPPEFSEPHFTTKMGPKGTAIQTTMSDLLSLPAKLLATLKGVAGHRFNVYLSYLKTPDLAAYHGETTRKGRETLNRRLSVVKDQDGKSRVIAIGDYWSQTV